MVFLNRFLSLLSACDLLFGFLVSGNVQAATAVAPPPIQVKAINDYLIYFFDGRRPAERYAKDWNWFDDAAMKLGVGTYVIHQGDTAVVCDIFTSVAQAKWVRNYMKKLGVKKFSVVHSHWHLEHIAGDAVYDDSDVITTKAKAAFICSSLIEKYTSKI